MSSETSTNDGFHASHFFVLLSLLAATAAVVMARPSAPEHLILISLTIGAAGLAGLCFYRMLSPLVAPHRDVERQTLSARMRVDLEREKALTLRSIKELEFDRAMGKVSPQDFDEMAGRLRQSALGIMKQLDAGSSAYRVLIEKELAARVGNRRPAAQQGGATRPVAMEAGTPVVQVARSVAAGLCACGTANDADARFCKSCGAKMRPA
ncbi:MAG: zinc ribbon domain-containing protein [Vicinamibacterales bacterium]